MSITRRKFENKDGKTVRSSVYTARFMFNGKLHRRGGFPDRETAQHWIDSTRLALRRGEVGYIKAKNAARILPLIEQFADHLRTLKVSWLYAYTSEKRLKRLASECPWTTIADFKPAIFEAWRASSPKWRKRPLSPATLNQYLDTCNEFGKWLHKPMGLLPGNPMADVSEMNAPVNDTYRRAATLDELAKLLDVAPPERSLFYRFLLYVPLRKRTYKAITWADLNLDGKRPTLLIRSETIKGARAVKMPIRKDLVADLKRMLKDAEPDDPVFPRVPDVDDLRADLAAAGVAFDDGKGGRRFDLHAFRKTAIRVLKKAGVSLDEAHVFLQHRDRRTTERYYDDDMVEPEISRAAERMPSLRLPSGKKQGSGIGAKLDTKRRKH